MATLARYKKAIGGFVAGVAVALSLLPTDADPRLLALIPLVNLLVVALAPKNAPAEPRTGMISNVMRPKTYKPPPRPGRHPGDPLE